MPTPLHLLSSMATRTLLAECLAEFEREHAANVRLEAVGGVDAARRVQAGESFDVVALAAPALTGLEQGGFIVPGSVRGLVISGVSVAVPRGRPHPDISTASAVREAVLATRSLGYSTGPSGTHLLKTFEAWGILDQVRERIVQAPAGVPVARLLAEGKVDLGFQQLSELLNAPGIDIVGPLPEGVQTLTTFAAGVASTCTRPAQAQTLIDFLAAPARAEAIRRHGMEPA